ncbi:Neutral/alkaline nonlysosomal ceramidase, partial [Ochromonadaceae sp. CCMP2298]
MLSFIPITVVMLGCLQIVSGYNVGTGIYDVTGPSVEINFMGYAVPGQRGTGIHMRLKARAFAFEDEEKRFVFVSVDGGMGSDLVNFRVVEKLNAALGEGVYSMDSISISGTHTHSGPAGFLQYVLYQMTSLGFVQETFDAWVDGITQAILLAHANLARGRVMLSQGPLYGANINRSPTSYLLNPSEERAKYDGDTDKNMFLLNLLSGDKPVGVLNWFAVHGTSMNNTNTLTSGDNRGYASYALERLMNGPSKAGKGAFVAAFASSNLGDVSPNTNGAKCIDTGLDCDGTSSTCNGRCENCIAFGPGEDGDMFQSTQIIGDKQFQHAVGLMDAGEEVSGKIDYRHSWVKMSELNVTLGDGSSVQLCSPAMGYSFAAGTTDGPGMFNFAQGTTTDSPFWDRVRDFLSTPTDLEIACQAPKPILLNTGDVEKPYEWDPETVPVQILRLGNVFVLSVPGELTTMA